MKALPKTYRPQLATLVKQPPPGTRWLHEIKYDGYRIGAFLERGQVTLVSRNGLDWTGRLPEIRDAVAALPARTLLLDGEVAIVTAEGGTSFQALQNAFGGGPRGSLAYFVFDLLFLDGTDYSGRTLEERKQHLAVLLPPKKSSKARLRYSEHFDGEGAEVLARACELGLEGIVSKHRDQPYRSGRNDGWLKSKCINRQEFVIGGFTDPEGKRQGIGALLIGYRGKDGRLTFAGKVGTGFSDRVARSLREQLEARSQSASPFSPAPAGALGRNAHWVRPDLVAEVAFTEWTGDGKIRHPSFQGLREDKPARAADRELPVDVAGAAKRASIGNASKRRTAGGATRTSGAGKAPVPAPPNRPKRGAARALGDPIVAGVKISHPDRVVFPDIGFTKLDLARYYDAIGDWILPHVRGRPLTLVRCPDGAGGACFYMKHSKLWAPPSLRRVDIREKTKIGGYLIIDDLAGLIGLVQMNVLEIHTWNARFERVEQPDRIVVDLDPGPDVEWRAVVEAARLVRAVLQKVRLESFVKTTGGDGLHVVVPLQPRASWAECLAFSQAVAEAIARSDPDRYTTAFAKRGREARILIDYLRNNRANTSVEAFSSRARTNGSVAVPLRWEELSARLKPDQFTVRTVPRRLDRLEHDPWAGYWTARQRIPASAIRVVERL